MDLRQAFAWTASRSGSMSSLSLPSLLLSVQTVLEKQGISFWPPKSSFTSFLGLTECVLGTYWMLLQRIGCQTAQLQLWNHPKSHLDCVCLLSFLVICNHSLCMKSGISDLWSACTIREWSWAALQARKSCSDRRTEFCINCWYLKCTANLMIFSCSRSYQSTGCNASMCKRVKGF